MGVRRCVLATAFVVCALICALPARALASSSQESILMDDRELIYSNPTHVAWTLEQAKLLGVDRIKVSVVWYLVAPDPNSRHRPNFDASDPAAYPYGAWTRYDRIVSDAQALGLKVYFQLVPPAPKWALAQTRATQGYPWSHGPSPTQFGQFVEAVGRRYGGSYLPHAANDKPRSAPDLADPVPGVTPPAAVADPAAPLPRVDYWGIWNEPNEGAWLNPQWRVVGHGRHRHFNDIGPALYRRLVDAAWNALQSTGHGPDTILIGETASHGFVYPLQFVRELYCVNSHDLPLTGNHASSVRCPRSGSRAAFAGAHPGLFDSTGYAHHPYSFDASPSTPTKNRSLLTLQNLGQLERTIDRIFNTYRRHRPSGVPMYLTEWGYKTNPPNPFVKTSLSEQAAWLNEGEYMTWKDSYVHALAQFLLVDDRPKAGEAVGSRSYWGTFQTGLFYMNDSPKPSYGAFRIPIWLPSARHGRNVTVWGELRPANHGAAQVALLQYEPRGGSNWSNVQQLETSNSEGFLLSRVPIPGAGAVRLAWLDPAAGDWYYSRTVKIS